MGQPKVVLIGEWSYYRGIYRDSLIYIYVQGMFNVNEIQLYNILQKIYICQWKGS